MKYFNKNEENLRTIDKAIKSINKKGKLGEDEHDIAVSISNSNMFRGVIDSNTIAYYSTTDNSFIIEDLETGDIEKISTSKQTDRKTRMINPFVEVKADVSLPVVQRVFDPSQEKFSEKGRGKIFVNMYNEIYKIKKETSYSVNWGKYKAISLLFDNVFGEHRDYFVNWLAYGLRYKRKANNAIVSVGKTQGTGKGLIYNKIIKRMFDKYAVDIDTSAIESNFNKQLETALFVFADELTNNTKNRDIVASRLKRYVAEPTIQIQAKGKDQYSAKSFFNMWITSNSDNPVDIEGSDRRFTVIETGKTALIYRLEEIGISDIESFISMLDAEFEQFFSDVLSLRVDISKATRCLVTQKKKDIVANTMMPSEILKEALISNDIETIEDSVSQEDIGSEFASKDMMINELREMLERGYIATDTARVLYRAMISNKRNITTRAIGKVFTEMFGKSVLIRTKNESNTLQKSRSKGVVRAYKVR
jgi:hypothetical protein